MQELYYTQSTNLASYLVMNGFEIVGTRRIKNTVTMYFEKTDKLHNCVRNYNKDTELKRFIASFKKVKEIIRFNADK